MQTPLQLGKEQAFYTQTHVTTWRQQIKKKAPSHFDHFTNKSQEISAQYSVEK